MKKHLNLFLAWVLALNIVLIPAHAIESVSENTRFCESNAEIINPAFLNSITNNNITGQPDALESTVPLKITYSYKFEKQENSIAKVDLSAIVNYKNTEFPIIASGYVDEYPLQKTTLWEGPLDGTAKINNINYDIIVGFAKTDDTASPQLNITISAPGDILGASYLLFGDDLITLTMQKELSEKQSLINEAKLAPSDSSHENILQAVSSKLIATFQATFGAYSDRGQTANVYFDNNNRIGISVNSYCDTLESHLQESKIIPSSYVNTVYIGLERNATDTANYSWIAGIEKFDTYGAGSKSVLLKLKPIFTDICSLIGIPTSTLDSLLDDLSGSVTVKNTTDDCSVTFEFTKSQNVNFDSSGPVVAFQLDRKYDGTYTGSSSYTVVTQVRYVTKLFHTQNKTIRHVYSDANDINRTIWVTLK